MNWILEDRREKQELGCTENFISQQQKGDFPDNHLQWAWATASVWKGQHSGFLFFSYEVGLQNELYFKFLSPKFLEIHGKIY